MALTFSDARNISIVDYLSNLGCQPTKIRGNDYWYHSPFRLDKDPSFKVDSKLNVWYDHGIGEGGNIIDLGMKLHQCTTHEFMIKLSNSNLLNDFSLHQKPVEPPENKLEVVSIKEFAAPELIDYINRRGIEISLARQYCKEVGFKIGPKIYSAVGFRNISGGYELRNSWFKGSSSPKDISFIDNHFDKLCVQEGFIDFLSVIQVDDRRIKELSKDSNFLVLNSLSMLNKSLPILGQHTHVILFLDNDDAGKKAKEALTLKGITFQDGSTIYSSFKDMNEYLLSKTMSVPTLTRSRGIHR
ncbi:toprim domain-containing protein [Chryseolinea sp. H1M3-3]|uniref:toprim domain-containing protein n=1 Tax=Chryseolinea sp. H1M3-3 TaxID=3034144 RepID=UPI0023ECBFED|nr:toprim domain-containing protein [Chryseolinea sp. H1M3-3]